VRDNTGAARNRGPTLFLLRRHRRVKPIQGTLVFPGVVLALLGCSLVYQATPSAQPTDEVVRGEPAETEGFKLVEPRRSDGDLAEVLAIHANRASELGLRPFVEFSAEWCPSCVALANSLDDERMIEAFRGTYIIRLDIDEWINDLPGSGFRVIGVPTFFEVDGSGMPTGRILTGAAWGEDIPENMAPCLQDFFSGQ
jgi:thiol:disulfide interchange protein